MHLYGSKVQHFLASRSRPSLIKTTCFFAKSFAKIRLHLSEVILIRVMDKIRKTENKILGNWSIKTYSS